jgi:DMSO reductase anchor subunit
VAAVATYVPALLFGLVWSGLVEAPGWIAPLGIVTALMAMVTVFCTARIYSSLATIRAWNTPLTAPVYLLFSLATGSAVLGAIASLFGRFQVFQVGLTVILLVILIALKLAYWRSIDKAPRTHTMGDATGLGRTGQVGQWEVPHTTENYIQKEMGYAVARKHATKLRRLVILLLVFSLIFMLAALLSPYIAIIAAALALAAAIFERWLFFAEAQHVVTLFYGAKAA